MALSAAVTSIIGDLVYDRSIRGAIFCHVIKIMQFIHENPSITPGNQKCRGAAPAFISKAIEIIINSGCIIWGI